MREPRPTIPPVLDRFAAYSWRILLIIALTGVVIFILSRLQLVVLALFISFLAVAVLSPLRDFLERRGLGHLQAVALVVAISGATIAGVLAAVVIPIINQAARLWDSIQEGIDRVLGWITLGPIGLSEGTVERYTAQLDAFFQENTTGIASGVIGTTMMGIEVIVSIALAAPITIFMLKDSRRINQWLLSWFAPDQRERIEAVGSHAWSRVSMFIRGIALVATVDAVFIGLALFFLDVPLAGSLAVLTFAGAFIPIVGAVVAGIAAVLVALVTEGPVAALIILGVVIGVQQLEGNVLAPLVVGRAVRLHPLAILLAVTIGGTLAGILGAFVAVPVTAVAYAVVTELYRTRPAEASDST